jgi:hypothetical protein
VSSYVPVADVLDLDVLASLVDPDVVTEAGPSRTVDDRGPRERGQVAETAPEREHDGGHDDDEEYEESVGVRETPAMSCEGTVGCRHRRVSQP